jgi:hypothetical protein
VTKYKGQRTKYKDKGRSEGPLREVWKSYLPIVKPHKHWAERAIREVRR